MALEKPPKLGSTPDTDSLDDLKKYSPPADKVLRVHIVTAGQTLTDVAKVAGLPFWDYVEFVFPGCEQDPRCVNWYLNYRLGCPETEDRKNRRFKGGERLAIPKPKDQALSREQLVDKFLKENQIIPRDSWGAKPPTKTPDADWDYTTAVLHHSGRRGETDPKEIQRKHMDKNGWEDVGYHFMINPVGEVYEGRRLLSKGSHVAAANTGKVGILVMGNFEKEWLILGGKPSAQQVQTAKRLLVALKQFFATLVELGGHKDYKKGTECPGNQLYPLLDDIRKDTGLLAPP